MGEWAMMKKIHVLTAGIFLFSLIASCKSAPEGQFVRPSNVGSVQGQLTASGDVVIEEQIPFEGETIAVEKKDDEKSLEKPKKERLPQTKAAKKGGTKETRMLKKQTVDPYTGWIYIPEKHFTITNGDVKIDLDGRTGTYCIYAVNEKSSTVPLLSTYDSFSSSFFSILYGNRMIELKHMDGIKTEARRTPYGGQLVYTVPKKVSVIIDFTFLPSIATSPRVDMLRITAYIINIGSSTEMISLKSIFDTILGEDSHSHFSTREDALITSEVQYTNFEKHKWIRSTDGDVSVQFILVGEGLRSPEFVTLANKASIEKSRWTPSVEDHKSFNSAVNYNNSEIAVNWNGLYLDPKQMDSFSFYVSVAINGEIPAGDDFIQTLSDGSVALGPDQIVRLQRSDTAPDPIPLTEDDVVSRYWENMPTLVDSSNIYWNPETLKFENTPVSAKVSNGPLPDYPVEKPSSSKPKEPKESSSKTPSATSKEKNPAGNPASGDSPKKSSGMDPQIDMAYVQALIEHIELLENSDEVDEAELKYLNDELDAIMSKLEGLE